MRAIYTIPVGMQRLSAS